MALTVESLWGPSLGSRSLDDVLSWPPDVFALVNRVLDASESYRFVVSPPPGVTLGGAGGGAPARAVAREWCEWLDGDRPSLPESLLQWWKVVEDAGSVGIEELAGGGEWHVIEALLAVHAIADEACAGLGSALAAPAGPGCTFRAAARELLADTGSLARLPSGVLRVLPRCRVSTTGISIHSLARHVCVRGPQVDVDWHRMLSRPAGEPRPANHANVVLLPWPLRVRARDFHPVAYTLPDMDEIEFGFFEFRPKEAFDLDLVDRVLRAAEDEAGTVDVVMLPEAAVTPADIAPLEAVLGEHGVWCLVTGVREPAAADGELGANWVHIGVRQEVVWRHAVQHKHHRWCLDGRQIGQYHLGGSLAPSMRWWEAVSIPRRSLQIIDQGAVTIAPLVCEDLARLEPVADLVRSIGPSLVMTLLLDGPQLASRWTARYASVLADDPGSTVCTLTSYGMVQRCRPPGCERSSVVALWKDASSGVTEISLDDGAEAVLIATAVTFGDSSTADGRRHPATTSRITLTGVQSLHAAATPPTAASTSTARASEADRRRGLPDLDDREVTKATSWAEAFAEAAVVDDVAVERVMAKATDCEWRAALGLPPPSRLFHESMAALRRELPNPMTLEGIVAAAERLRRSPDPVAAVTGTLVGIALEERIFVGRRGGQ